jgi:hypothetical protein
MVVVLLLVLLLPLPLFMEDWVRRVTTETEGARGAVCTTAEEPKSIAQPPNDYGATA